MNPLRVVMIIQNFHPFIGGAEKQAQALSAELVARGHKVNVLTRAHESSPREEVIQGVAVHRLMTFGDGLINSFGFILSSSVYVLFHWKAIDVLHIHLASSHAILPAIFGRILGKRVVVKLGGGYDIGEMALSRKTLIGKLKLKILSWANPTFVVVNEGQLNELKKSGLGNSPVVFIPNGVDLRRFRPASAEEKQALRSKNRWEGLVFLIVGRFAADKLRLDIFDRFLEAWSHISRNSQQVYLYLVGEGPLEAEYQKSIARFDVEDSVEILGRRDEVVDLYRAADVFVLPSITEGLSNAMLEAMACGMPVFGSRVPGVVDVITHGENGILFDPLNTGSIGQAIKELSGSLVNLKEMGKAGVLSAQKYSLERTVDQYLGLYTRAYA